MRTTACRVIKEYEREARVDGVPAQEVMATKQRYVSQVNQYVGRKKEADRGLKTQIAAQQAGTAGGTNGASTSADPYGYGAGAFAAANSPGTGGPPQQKQLRGARFWPVCLLLPKACWTRACAPERLCVRVLLMLRTWAGQGTVARDRYDTCESVGVAHAQEARYAWSACLCSRKSCPLTQALRAAQT